MFNWLFGGKNNGSRDNNLLSLLFHFTLNKDTKRVKQLIEDNKINDLFDKKYRDDIFDYKYRDDYGNTLLHIAVKTYNVDLTRYLILKGIDTEAINFFGERAIDIAKKNNNVELIQILSDIIVDKELKKKIDNLELDKRNYQADLTQTKVKLNEANNQIKTLKRKRNENIQVVEKENKRLKTEKSSLSQRISSLEKNNSLIKENFRKIKLQNNKLVEENKATIIKLDQMKEKKIEVEKNNIELKKTIETLRDSFKK